MTIYYKVLSNGQSCHGGNAAYALPHDGQPGEWMPDIKGDLMPCKNGYHVCRRQDLLSWLDAEIYECEIGAEFVVADDKVCARCIRLLRKIETWNDRTARLFAADCAERVLPTYERDARSDQRPRKAIQAARDFANGLIDKAQLAAAWAAARDAAWAAAWDAARAAARDAAWDAAWAAAWDAAWAVARAAAWAAARDAARDAEIEWQTNRLFEYLDGKVK